MHGSGICTETWKLSGSAKQVKKTIKQKTNTSGGETLQIFPFHETLKTAQSYASSYTSSVFSLPMKACVNFRFISFFCAIQKLHGLDTSRLVIKIIIYNNVAIVAGSLIKKKKKHATSDVLIILVMSS